MRILGPVLAAPPIMYHIAMDAALNSLALNTITEILTFAPGPTGIEFASGGGEMKRQISGVAIEEAGLGDVEGRPLVALVEWEDRDGKGKGRESTGYRLVFDQGLEGKEVEVERCHVRFQKLDI
jgi:hypothetical protein